MPPGDNDNDRINPLSVLTFLPAIAGALPGIIGQPERKDLRQMQRGGGVGSRALSGLAGTMAREQYGAQSMGQGATRGLGLIGATERANQAIANVAPAMGMTAAREQALATRQLRANRFAQFRNAQQLGAGLTGALGALMANQAMAKDQGAGTSLENVQAATAQDAEAEAAAAPQIGVTPGGEVVGQTGLNTPLPEDTGMGPTDPGLEELAMDVASDPYVAGLQAQLDDFQTRRLQQEAATQKVQDETQAASDAYRQGELDRANMRDATSRGVVGGGGPARPREEEPPVGGMSGGPQDPAQQLQYTQDLIIEQQVRKARALNQGPMTPDIPGGERVTGAIDAMYGPASPDQEQALTEILRLLINNVYQPGQAYTQAKATGIVNPEEVIGWSRQSGWAPGTEHWRP